ncbi:hypothetical protein PoB_005647600 [Plakobranchus ocellatus]|uniref:DDE Tnp4 domain-containing protein n=1 Tax=Plakobranchus ocellatus TaxID=259542 RepID=A0AAV4CF22_9GAST|nr:hypothetical protein PoB_005647600 [Plakobranchus ocellatus]
MTVHAQNASVKVVTNMSSYLCTDQYLVVGEDSVTCAWELSGNNSDYTYNEFFEPYIRMETFTLLHDGSLQLLNDALICTPFDLPKNGFCNKVNRYNPACSCEAVGPQVYRVKYVLTLNDVRESRGKFTLIWPSLGLKGYIKKVCYIPEVKAQRMLFFAFFPQHLALCTPFAEPINGFCVTKHSFPNGCSCENVGVDRYRLRANVTATSTRMSNAKIFLTWPGKYGPKQYNYSLPEIKMKPTYPKIRKFRSRSFFNCSQDYQVLGEDYTLLELIVFQDNSVYSYEKDLWPRFEYKNRTNGKLSKPITFCTPFSARPNSSCVTKEFFPNGCSCKQVDMERYLLAANFTATALETSRGVLSLTWPGPNGPTRYEYNLPEVRIRPSIVFGDERKHWVHPVNAKREECDEFYHFAADLRQYPEVIRSYSRMPPQTFSVMLDHICNGYNRQDTNYWKAISLEELLALTLRRCCLSAQILTTDTELCGRLIPEMKVSNYRHSRARRCVECASEVLSARWRVIKLTIATDATIAETIVLAAVALHNAIITLEINSKN